jgi:site-specific DNA recombinase
MTTLLNYKNIRFCLYVRKSQNREDRQIASIESQIRELKEFAKKMNFKIYKVYEDSASAHIPANRVQFKQMLEDLKKGEVNAILTWKPDRLSRNMIDGGQLIHSLQTESFALIQTPYSRYLPIDNMLPLIIEMGMANQYSLDLSKNVKRGNKTKIQNGGFCNMAPIGYKNCKETKTIIKDPVRFDKVRQLFECYLSGKYSLSQLSKLCGKKLQLTGLISHKPLSVSSIQKILINPFYYGKVYNGEHEQRGNHPQLIRFSEHEKIQKLLQQLGRRSATSCDFAYTGMMHCGECGCAITAEEKVKYNCPTCNKKQTAKHPRKCTCGYQITTTDISKAKRYTYYHCSKSKQKCTQRFLNAKKLDLQFEEFITQLHKNMPCINFAKQWVCYLEGTIQQGIEIKKKEQSEQQKEVQLQLDRLLELRIQGDINKDLFIEKNKVLQENLKRVEEVSSQKIDSIKKVYKELEFLENLKYYALDKDENRIGSLENIANEIVNAQWQYLPQYLKYLVEEIFSRDDLLKDDNGQYQTVYVTGAITGVQRLSDGKILTTTEIGDGLTWSKQDMLDAGYRYIDWQSWTGAHASSSNMDEYVWRLFGVYYLENFIKNTDVEIDNEKLLLDAFNKIKGTTGVEALTILVSYRDNGVNGQTGGVDCN